MQALSQSELQDALTHLPAWQLSGGALVQQRRFTDFRQAMHFVNELAELAERRGHHPDIDIRYNQVRLALLTHDAGGITTRDTEMAAEIDSSLSNS